jgi:hypothetical protein
MVTKIVVPCVDSALNRQNADRQTQRCEWPDFGVRLGRLNAQRRVPQLLHAFVLAGVNFLSTRVAEY